MSSFTTGLKVEFIDGKHWRILEDFIFEIGELGSDEKVTIRPGFITDFASIPWPFGILISKTKGHGKAAVVHDYLYASQEIMSKTCTRKRADLVFLEAMGVLKVFWLKRHIMYLAVRWFGWLSWCKHRRSLA